MHPEQIKAAIRMRGTTPTAMAAKLAVTPTTVWQVIHSKGRSERIEKAISALIGQPLEVIWPDHKKATGIKRDLKKAGGKPGARRARHV